MNSTIHTLAEAHRSAWADAIRTDDNNAYIKAEAIARDMADIPATTPESYREKAELVRLFFRGGTAADFIVSIFDEFDDAELINACSFLDDALRFAEA